MTESCSSFVTSSSRAISIVTASTDSLPIWLRISAASGFSKLNSTIAALRIPCMGGVQWSVVSASSWKSGDRDHVRSCDILNWFLELERGGILTLQRNLMKTSLYAFLTTDH